jgi:hypothetical protein
MRDEPITPEKIAKLPKWAQAHIRELNSQRESAVSKLDQYEDGNTPTNVWQEEYCYDTKSNTLRKRYIQADRVEFQFQGVHLTVSLVQERGVELSWRPAGGRAALGDLCFIPTSYQQARISNLVYNPDEIERLQRVKKRDDK